MILWVIFLFYVFIMFLHLIHSEPKVSFEKLDVQINKFTPYQSCSSDIDCNKNEKCFTKQCYPTYRGTRFCNYFTGSWVLKDVDGVLYLKCTCRFPNIVDQKYDGGNCDLDVACAPHGHLKSMFMEDLSLAECLCKKGYKSLSYPQIGCKKLLPSEIEKSVCDVDEIPIMEASNVYSINYLNSIPIAKKCIKNPCKFNIFNGKPLKNTKFDFKNGCICDPRFGNFGVKFDNLKNKYLITEGYDACGNIFQSEPNVETRVRLYSYFYINGQPPKSFIQFSNLKVEYLIPELQNLVKDKHLQIDELWPYNFTQYLLENEYFLVHTRECFLETFLEIENCYERLMREKQMINCEDILNQVPNVSNRHLQTYALLYKYPVCKFTNSELGGIYKERYILNPYMLSHNEYRSLLRSNGIEIHSFQDDKWILNLAPSNFDQYQETSIFPTLQPLPRTNQNVLQTSGRLA